jgi:hypothetical protein
MSPAPISLCLHYGYHGGLNRLLNFIVRMINYCKDYDEKLKSIKDSGGRPMYMVSPLHASLYKIVFG